MSLVPLPDNFERMMSNDIMSNLSEILAQEECARVFDRKLQEEGVADALGSWRIAELLYHFHANRMWEELNLIDEKGYSRPFNSFDEYVDNTPLLPFAHFWGYILRGCHEHYRVRLKIEENKELTQMMLGISFEKLYVLRPVIKNFDQAYNWFAIAQESAVKALRVRVKEALNPRKPKQIVKPRQVQWVSERSSFREFSGRPLEEVLKDLEDIPDDAIVEIQVRIVDWKP